MVQSLPTTSPSTQPQGGGITRNQYALPANLVQIRIANALAGYLDEFSAQEDFGLQPLVGIGDARPQEWVPGMYNITITATRGLLMGPSIFGLLNKAAQNSSVASGGTPAFGNMDAALQGIVFDCVMQQKGQSGTTLRVYRNCSIASCSVSVRANALIMTNITIRALDASNDGDGGDFSGSGGHAVSNMDTTGTS